MSLETFAQHLLNGLQLGSFFALIAVGYSMVYGVLLLINFAHGDIFMVGAFLGMFIGLILLGAFDPHLPFGIPDAGVTETSERGDPPDGEAPHVGAGLPTPSGDPESPA